MVLLRFRIFLLLPNRGAAFGKGLISSGNWKLWLDSGGGGVTHGCGSIRGSISWLNPGGGAVSNGPDWCMFSISGSSCTCSSSRKEGDSQTVILL